MNCPKCHFSICICNNCKECGSNPCMCCRRCKKKFCQCCRNCNKYPCNCCSGCHRDSFYCVCKKDSYFTKPIYNPDNL